ncbi:hypothetical protein PybrP1_001262, partial [[Pythium] brassicae (nom. inval.)]
AAATAVRVLRNASNSVYHRALAARALGLLAAHDHDLSSRLRLESEELVDALLQIVTCCRRSRVQSVDTRRVHVNCCLVISLLMQVPRKTLQLLVSLDSELLTMPPQPSDRSSAFLLLTVAGRLASGAPPSENCLRNANQQRHVLPSLAPLLQSPRDRGGQRVAGGEEAALADSVARRQTPSRVFKMERFRVVTPAFVNASVAADAARLTPLPVIRPARGPQRIESERSLDIAAADHKQQAHDADDGDNDDDDARIEAASAPQLPMQLCSAVLLHPTHMLEVFRSKRMPLASPAFFARHLRDEDAARTGGVRSRENRKRTPYQLPPPSRLQVLEWSEWKRKGLTEETADTDTSSVGGVVLATERTEDVSTLEYKQKRLREILSAPVEPSEANAAQLRSLARRVNTSLMVSLGAEADELRREEQQVRREMHAFIQAERDQLPLKFLFQLPGGAAYCRHRMRRAMALWILAFEDNQRRMALVQWKAFVEHCRFQLRGQEYHRVAVERRLRVAVEFVLRGYLTQAITRWAEATQERIWADRDRAARTIQAQARRHFGRLRFLWLHDSAPVGGRVLRDIYLAPCRGLAFQIPPRVREERRAVWRAAELVQSAYRRRRFRVFLARYRAAASTIQAQQRMRAARTRYHAVRRRIIGFQAYVRMLRHRRAYTTLRDAAMLVQSAFRGVRVQRLRRLVVCAQRREHEWFLSSVLLAQRVARGFLGRRAAREIRRVRDDEFAAALVVQRAWYRRNNEWSTFLLLACLRAKESEEDAFAARVLAFKRHHMARQIRRAWTAHLSRKRNATALVIQRAFRQHAARRAVQFERARKLAHRRIKWFFRVHHARRIRMATVVQFGWLRAAPGRLAAHLRTKRLAQQHRDARATYVREAHAAALMQALVRGHNARVVARRERSARKMQRAIRAFLRRRRVQRELRRITGEVARHAVEEYVAASFGAVFTRHMQTYDSAATQLQRLYRGARCRSLQTRSAVWEELCARMATRVQSLWRLSAHRRMAKKLLQAQRRKLANPFQAATSLSAVLQDMVQRSSVFFDPDDDLRGMALPSWLRRLGLDATYLELFQKSRWLTDLVASGRSSAALPTAAVGSVSALAANGLTALAALREMDPDACRRHLEAVGVQDEADLELMATSLFAQYTLRAAQQLRSRIASMRAQQTSLKRSCDLAAMALQKLEASRREAASALEAVLDEAREFRHPPLALRKCRDKCEKEFEQAATSVADAQQRSDRMTQTLADAERKLGLLQQEFAQVHEPHEMSALYSQQSLKLITNTNRIREMFLARFPGLEARALTFASALGEAQVTTWQLERFFDAHTSVSAVKASMHELTYFALETEAKKLESACMLQCADVLQFGFERMCDLLAIPIEAVVLARRESVTTPAAWGLVHQALLDTVGLVCRASKASERARAWRQGVDALLRMNRTALGVQSMWRRRAATKLMAIVRGRRRRERTLAVYVAEARADHVTPIWRAERTKEQEELDAWLAHEALARRRERLEQTLRFPFVEEWDDASQTYVYWRADESALDGSGRQYALGGKPVYTVEEEDAAVVVQAAVRAFLARLERLARQREQRRLVRRAALETAWNRTRDERSQTVTLQLGVCVAANKRIASWLQQRREAARQHAVANAPPSTSSSGKSTKTTTTTKKKKKQTTGGAAVASERLRPALPPSEGAAGADAGDSDADAAWKKQMGAFADGPLTAAYNRSVRAAHRKDWAFPALSRPLNAHGQAIVGLLSQFVQLQSHVARGARGSVRLRLTKAELRFGWQEVRSEGLGGSAPPYYFNSRTGDTTWERPEYTFDDEFAAITVQSLARVLVAKSAFARQLDAISFVETVHQAVQKAARVGWVGFGLEGVSTAVFLSRFGLAKYAKELSRASIDDVVALSEARAKKLGWTKEELGLLKSMAELRAPQHRAKPPLLGTARGEAPVLIPATPAPVTAQAGTAVSTRHPFSILPSERLVSQIVSQSFPNQQGRVLGLVKAIRASSTPISFRQLETHLRKFAGRPDDALSSIGEIASLEVATREPQELTVAGLFLRCVERCVVFAANLQLRSLQRHLSSVLCVARLLALDAHADAVALAPTTPLTPELLDHDPDSDSGHSSADVERYKQAAVARYPQKIVKGLWEQDPSTQEAAARFSAAQVALYLREAGLERVLLYVRSALLCQSAFRMHVARRWYVATQAFRARAATRVQCAWRVRCAREAAALLESQQQSDYEQRYDKRAQRFFFVYAPTQETLLDEPRDERGAMLAFRPMVQDRATKRWVRAWPHLEKSGRGRQPRDGRSGGDDDDAGAGPLCSGCCAERAARRCNECYSASGDYVDLCLACFFDRHAPENAETSWHAYQALRRATAQGFHCVECRRFSTQRCLQCDEHYCARCFQRVHGRGHTRTRHTSEQYDAMAQVCVECEARVAFQLCLVCQDALCEACMARTHSRGARAAHDLKLIQQSVADGRVHCEQCHARCGDERCEFCSRALCSPCLSDKHALICPETELHQKRRQLLGDKVCVDCGKAADRVCETCGDRYCSVRWMGNPGCFERFHGKGKRADHAFIECEAPTMSREILELEERVRLKRKQDAEAAEAEAKKLAAAMLALASGKVKPATTVARKKKRSLKSRGSKRRVATVADAAAAPGSRRCCVETCAAPALGDGVAFCAKHLTLQHALEVTKQDPLGAAKLLTQVERAGGKLPGATKGSGSVVLGSKLLGKATVKMQVQKTKKQQR